MQKGHIDDDVIEIEFASAAFLEKALKKEIAPGVIPARVVAVVESISCYSNCESSWSPSRGKCSEPT